MGNSTDLKLRIKELESKLKLCDYDHRIKLHETWYWMGDGEDHLESLTCPIIINTEDLRDLLADERQKAFKEVGEYLDKQFKHRHSPTAPTVNVYPSEIAKLKSGQLPRED